MRSIRRLLRPVPLLLAAVVGATLSVGCETDNSLKELAGMNTSNIQRLSNLYAGFHNAKGGSGPKDEAEFKEFIKAYAPDRLTAMGIDANNLDKTFTSERDNKPFKIRYKVGGGRGAVVAVVFEQDGVGGKKQVGFTGGKVEEVDDAEYATLWSGKGGSTPAAGPSAGGPPAGGGGRPGAGGPPAGAPTGPPGGK
jgi:hypothetical protein